MLRLDVPAVTLSTVDPLIVPPKVSVAVIVVTPSVVVEVATPADEMVATAVFDEVHVTLLVQSAVVVLVPSVNDPVAVKFSVLLTASDAPLGDTVMPVSWTSVAVAAPVFVLSETNVAVAWIVAGALTAVGAVYTPELASMLPGSEDPSDQVTVVEDVPVTAALNGSVPPGTTVEVPAVAVTVTGGGGGGGPPPLFEPLQAVIAARTATTRKPENSLERIGIFTPQIWVRRGFPSGSSGGLKPKPESAGHSGDTRFVAARAS